jgi:hypothetical protein
MTWVSGHPVGCAMMLSHGIFWCFVLIFVFIWNSLSSLQILELHIYIYIYIYSGRFSIEVIGIHFFSQSPFQFRLRDTVSASCMHHHVSSFSEIRSQYIRNYSKTWQPYFAVRGILLLYRTSNKIELCHTSMY